MLFENLITENKTAFLAKVELIANKLGVNPDWLMIAMYKESRINHRAVNKTSGATGLIQFMPATAKGLGTTTEALKTMSNVSQLDYVFAYLKPYASKIKSYEDLYLSIFFPAMLGKGQNAVIESKNLSAETVAKANQALDFNKDGKITVAEFYRWAWLGISEDVKKKFRK